jgi:hypothetical protein
VSELIGIAGGEDCFGELSVHPNAKQRILADPAVVIPARRTSSSARGAASTSSRPT